MEFLELATVILGTIVLVGGIVLCGLVALAKYSDSKAHDQMMVELRERKVISCRGGDGK